MSLYSALISHDIAALGTAAAGLPITVDADKKLVWTTTSAVTSNPMAMTNTMTSAGTTGGRMLIELAANVKLGGWCQAIKAYTNFGAAGAVQGLASAINAEMQLGAACSVTGTYAPLEAELVMATGSGGGSTKTGFMWMNVSGAAAAALNSNGYLFMMGGGITDSGLFQTASVSGVNSTHALRVNIAGTDYFIPIHTSVGFA